MRLDHESEDLAIISSIVGVFVSLDEAIKKLLSITGEGGGDSCGEFAASITFISSPIRPAVSATMADSSASSSSSFSEDDDEDDNEAIDDELDELEDEDEDEDDDEDDDFEESERDDGERGRMSLGRNSKSLITNFFSVFFLGFFFRTLATGATDGGRSGLGLGGESMILSSSLLSSSSSSLVPT